MSQSDASGDPNAVDPQNAEQLTDQVADLAQQLRDQVGQMIVGQDEVIEQVLLCLFTRGHALLVGVPGLAKTMLVSTIARTLGLEFSRIQFTPDLMPSDITGTEVIEENRTTGQRELRFVKGPIFANVILADEINRTPPKTQAALLEAMQEHHVTAGGMRHAIPLPFFVLATQNPIEQEGTYPLPEAQLDRFMFNIRVKYPSETEELDILKRTTTRHEGDVQSVMSSEQVQRVQQLIRDVPVADHVMKYVLRLVRATRSPDRGEADTRPDFCAKYLAWGAGPRASQYLVLAGKARAIIQGRTHVTAEDIQHIAHPVLRHRLITNFNAEADGIETDDLIDQLLDTSPVEPKHDAQMEQVMR
jgi:MoxR-like ATPase